MNHVFMDVINANLRDRDDLEKKIMDLIFSRFQPISPMEKKVKGIKRGQIQKFIWGQLGFFGDPPNHFDRYMNDLMLKNGFIATYRTGHHIYKGIKERNVEE